MPVTITTPGVTFAGARFRPRITSGLKGWFILAGESLSDAMRNHAPGGANATIVGSPQVSEDHVLFDSLDNFFQTDISDVPQHTFLAIARSDASFLNSANTPILISNYDTPADVGGVAMFMGATTIRSTVHVSVSGVATASVCAENTVATDLKLYACRYNGGVNTAFNLTDGTREDVVPAGLVRVLSSAKMRIGSGIASFGGTSEMSLAALYDRALSDTEILGWLADDARLVADSLGLTV